MHLENRRKANHKLTMDAINLAQRGYTVELLCSASDIVEFRSTPTPGQGYFNGKPVEMDVEA